ncbi:MAG: hypothetical protein GY940_03345 [bacterium]|nr:hypothetical protein [bacterium]
MAEEQATCPDCLGRGKKALYKHGHPVVSVHICDTCGGSGSIGPGAGKPGDSPKQDEDGEGEDKRKWSHIIK